jgi:hypothetical protein
MTEQFISKSVKVSKSPEENPIKSLVHEYDDQDLFIDELVISCLKLKNNVELQKRYKKNKEFIYTNHIERRFYYHRDKSDAPRITICIIHDLKQKMYHRGISICSYLDIVNKEDGRDIAEDRAINAMRSKISKEEINRGDIIQMEYDMNCIWYDYKSDYDVEITEFERKLFTPKTVKE